jgi:ATP synthase protein I
MAKGKKTHDRSAADRDLGQDSEDARLNARLARLSEALDRTQPSSEPRDTDRSPRQSLDAANLGFRALVEFVTTIVVAPIVGWQIDAWLKTRPIFLIIFLFLGMAAGLLNVYRIAVAPTGPTRGPKKD